VGVFVKEVLGHFVHEKESQIQCFYDLRNIFVSYRAVFEVIDNVSALALLLLASPK
jgi:hypothetical protein